MIKKDAVKKHMNRMRQLANQNLGRAEKTEVLNEDLQHCEKRVDQIKHACQNTTKKLSACLQSQGMDVEKRMKKLPHFALAQTMEESGKELGENSIFGNMLVQASDVSSTLALELTSFETSLEKFVIAPLSGVLENEIPAISTVKKKLTKLTLDLDSSKSRYHQAVRGTQYGKTNFAEMASKTEVLKVEQEESQKKVNQTRDQLSMEMMTLITKEGELARTLIDYVESQAQYHRNALAKLERMIPAMKQILERDVLQPIFGCALEDHLKVTEREIALVIEACVITLVTFGLEEEGLFRLAGSQSKIKKLKAMFDSWVEIDMGEYEKDLHTVAGVLKMYLRELPEPLLTTELYDEFLQAGSIQDSDTRLQTLWTIANKLPTYNDKNFRYLMKFLNKVSQHSEVNKMNTSNLALVIAPNILWTEKERGVSVTSTAMASLIIESFIAYADWFFPEVIEFELSDAATKRNSLERNSAMLDQTDSRHSPSPESKDSPLQTHVAKEHQTKEHVHSQTPTILAPHVNNSTTTPVERSRPVPAKRPSKRKAPKAPAVGASLSSPTSTLTRQGDSATSLNTSNHSSSESAELLLEDEVESKMHQVPPTNLATSQPVAQPEMETCMSPTSPLGKTRTQSIKKPLASPPPPPKPLETRNSDHFETKF
ncbi:rho GTPase-activating protein 17-like isoform X2 [Antedon mediterranea]|uniref:rho GTPase-activating protein 17-like isoform X2 n=1 Tax=Antedon mediterranea TaxID=105859 RepID=UPI003AF4F3C3